jgi:hypothetical protein
MISCCHEPIIPLSGKTRAVAFPGGLPLPIASGMIAPMA